MKNATDNRFSIIPQGGVKEEIWERSDIETMCRSGRLAPGSLVFVPEENAWKKLVDTDLASCFQKRDEPAGKGETNSRDDVGRREEYDKVLQSLRNDPGNIGLRSSAAELALAMGMTDAARDHYQEALAANPYHPRIAQEAKRSLPAAARRSLKFLEKPPQVWEDPTEIFLYPYTRGTLLVALPAAVLTGLFWTVWTAVPAVFVLSLWTMEIVRSASRGEKRAPLPSEMFSDPMGRIVRPAVIAVIAAIEICALFAVLSGLLILTRLAGGTNLVLVVVKSPFLTVLLCTVSLFYLPAVFLLGRTPSAGIRDATNPKIVLSALRVMESEYVVSAFFVAVLFFIMWGIVALFGGVPAVDRAFFGVGTVYIVLAGSFVFGRLHARFSDELESRTLGAASSPE